MAVASARLHAVQTTSSAPLERAWRLARELGGSAAAARHWSDCMWPWEHVGTSAADGILDDETYDWLPVVAAIDDSGGAPVVVAEHHVAEAAALVREHTSIAASATGTAGLAGLLAIRDQVADDERVRGHLQRHRPQSRESGHSTGSRTPVVDVVDEAADVVLVDDERAELEPLDALADVGVRVGERLERPPRPDAGLVLDLRLEPILVDRLQPAVGVVHQDDLACAEEALRQHQRADDVVGHHATGVADDVRIAVGQPQHLEDVHAAVHACHDRQLAPRGAAPDRGRRTVSTYARVVGDQRFDVRREVGGGGVAWEGRVSLIEGTSIARSSSDGSVWPMSDALPTALESGFDPRSDVFNRLLKNRVIMLGTDVNDEIANSLCAQLLYLEGEDANADIWLYINSPGGSVYAGMAIYDTMQFVSCDVATVCMGMAASMGQFLLTAGAAGKRFTLPNARVMMHQPLAGLARPGGRHRHPGRAARVHQEAHGRAHRVPHRSAGREDPGRRRARPLVHRRRGRHLRPGRQGHPEARRDPLTPLIARLVRWPATARRFESVGGGSVVAVTGLVGGGGVPMSVPQFAFVYCWMRVAAGWLDSAASFATATDAASPATTVAAVSKLSIITCHSG